MKERPSIRGQLIRDVVVPLGTKIITLERMNTLQYKLWKVPNDLINETVILPNCTGEFLKSKYILPEYVFLQLHGGAYTRPYYDAYRRNAEHIIDCFNNVSVFSIDYRIAPKNPYPCALDDAISAYNYLLNQGYLPQNIAFIGDSAGGGLNLALIEYLKDHQQPLPALAICMSPWTNLVCDFPSFMNNKEIDKMLGASDEMLINNSYCGDYSPNTPYISPYYGNVDNLCPILIQVGSNERLVDDAIYFTNKVKEVSGQIICTVYPGMFHVFQLFYSLPESKVAWMQIKKFIKSIWKEIEVIDNE